MSTSESERTSESSKERLELMRSQIEDADHEGIATAQIASMIGLDPSKIDFFETGVTKEKIEQLRLPSSPRRVYGALPHFDDLREHLKALLDDYKHCLAKYGRDPASFTPFRKFSMLLHRLKFGESVCGFVDRVLDHYPPRETGKAGQIISLYGPTGVGKSTVLRQLKNEPGIVVIDADTARMNFAAQDTYELESKHGAGLSEIREHLMYNPAASGIFYLKTDLITQELKRRGYTVIQLATQPVPADKTFFLERPGYVVPLPKEQLPPADEQGRYNPAFDLEMYPDFVQASSAIQRVTRERVQALFQTKGEADIPPDDYPYWGEPKRELDFRKMREVTVQIPPDQVLRLLWGTLNSFAASIDHEVLTNRADDPAKSQQEIAERIRAVVKDGSPL